MYCTVLYCTVMYCTVLYCTLLYCTVMYCTVMYCTVLYYCHLVVNPTAVNKYIQYIYCNISLYSSYSEKYFGKKLAEKIKRYIYIYVIYICYIHYLLSVREVMWNNVVWSDRTYTLSKYVIILLFHHNNG